MFYGNGHTHSDLSSFKVDSCPTCDHQWRMGQNIATPDLSKVPETPKGPKMRGKSSGIHLCEREGCGAMGVGAAMGMVTYVTDPTQEETGIDLCPACITEFLAWLAMSPENRAGRAFKKPYETPKDPEISRDDLILAAAEKIVLADRPAIEAPDVDDALARAAIRRDRDAS